MVETSENANNKEPVCNNVNSRYSMYLFQTIALTMAACLLAKRYQLVANKQNKQKRL